MVQTDGRGLTCANLSYRMSETDQFSLGVAFASQSAANRIIFPTMKEIAEKGYNLNISRYVSTALEEAEVDLAATHVELVRIEGEVAKATAKHNEFLKELGLPLLPLVSLDAS